MSSVLAFTEHANSQSIFQKHHEDLKNSVLCLIRTSVRQDLYCTYQMDVSALIMWNTWRYCSNKTRIKIRVQLHKTMPFHLVSSCCVSAHNKLANPVTFLAFVLDIPGLNLSQLRFLTLFLKTQNHLPMYHYKWGWNRFLPCPFQLILHKSSNTIWSTLFTVSLNKQQIQVHVHQRVPLVIPLLPSVWRRVMLFICLLLRIY